MEAQVSNNQAAYYMNHLQKQEPLSAFVGNQEELKLVKLIEDGVMIQRLENPKETVLELVTQWRFAVGLPKEDVSEELVVVTNFILMNYAHMTLGEIENAINMSIMKQLKDCDFFGHFSPMYCASVLESYLHYRKIRLADAVKRRQQYLIKATEERNRPTQEQQAENMKEILSGLWQEFQEMGVVKDPFNLAYEYLYRIGALHVNFKDLATGIRNAVRENSIMRQAEFKTVGDYSLNERRLAKNWLVQNYFSSLQKVEQVLMLVDPIHFGSKDEQMKQYFSKVWNYWKETSMIDDIETVCYDYLRNNKLMPVYQPDLNSALAFAKGKVSEMNGKEEYRGLDMQQVEKMLGRNWLVENFFMKHKDLDEILVLIKPQENEKGQ